MNFLLTLLTTFISFFSFLYFTSNLMFDNPRIREKFLALDKNANHLLTLLKNSDIEDLFKKWSTYSERTTFITFILMFVTFPVFKNTSYIKDIIIILSLILMTSMWFLAIFRWSMISHKDRISFFFNKNIILICLAPVLFQIVFSLFGLPEVPFLHPEFKKIIPYDISVFYANLIVTGFLLAALAFMLVVTYLFLSPLSFGMYLLCRLMIFILNFVELNFNKNIFSFLVGFLTLFFILLQGYVQASK